MGFAIKTNNYISQSDMKLPYFFLTDFIDQVRLKQLIVDALTCDEEIFKEIKRSIPSVIKIPGFSSVRKVPFSNSKALTGTIIKNDIFKKPDLAKLIFKGWFCSKNDLKEVVKKELEQNDYKPNDPNFDEDFFEINPLERKDVHENDGGSFFRPNGKKIDGYDEEDVTIMAALYGWGVMDEEFFDGLKKKLDEEENISSNGNELLDDNEVISSQEAENISPEIETPQKTESRNAEVGDELLAELGELGNMILKESDSLTELSEKLRNGYLIDLRENSKRLNILKDKVFAIAKKIDYPNLNENVDINSIKTFYLKEIENKKNEYVKDRIYVLDFLNNIKQIAVKKGDTPVFAELIKNKADEYILKIEGEDITEDDWFTSILNESHFFNHLKNAIELSLKNDEDTDALDELLDKLKNLPADFDESIYDQLSRQILRKNLYFIEENDPEPNPEKDKVTDKNNEPEVEFNTETATQPESQTSKDIAIDKTEPDEQRVKALEENKLAETENKTEQAIHEDLIKDGLNNEDREIIKLLLNDEPYLAFHLAKCFEKSGSKLLLPSTLLENLSLAPIIRSETGQVAQKMSENFGEIPFEFQKTEIGYFLNQILFAALLRPSLFAYNTSGAGYFLDYIHSGKSAEFDGIKKLLLEFMTQRGHEVSFEKLHLATDKENIAEQKDQFKANIKQWLEKAEVSRFRNKPNHPFSIVFAGWIKSDGKICKALSDFIENDAIQPVEILLYNFLDQNIWLKEFERQLKEVAGNSKSIYDNAEAKRWISNHIEGLKDILSQGITLFKDSKNDYEQRIHADFFDFIAKFKQELGNLKEHLKNHENETLFDKVATKYLNVTVSNLERLLSGEEEFHGRPDLMQYKYSPLLKLGFYESSFDMTPVDYNQQLEYSILEYNNSLRLENHQILQKHLESGNFEAYNRMLTIMDIDGFELKTISDQQDYFDRFEFECKRVQTNIERGCVYGYITNGKRAQLISALENIKIKKDRIDEIMPDGINFPLKEYLLKNIEDEINIEKIKIIDEHKNLINEVSESQIREILEKYLNEGNVIVFNDTLQRIKSGDFTVHEEELDYFNEYFNVFLAQKEGKDSTDVISIIEGRDKFSVIDFSSITEHQIEESSFIMNQWFFLKNNRKQEAFNEFDNYKKILDGLGFFDAKKTNQEKLKRATYFDFECTPNRGRNRTPLPKFGSFAKGKYRLITITQNLNEEDLFEQIRELEPETERALIVFNFVWMNQASRLEVFRLSKKRGLSFLMLDEAMLIYLMGVKESRFPVFVKLAAPFSFDEPYQTGASNLPEEMFYGRTPQIQQLKNNIGDYSCLIYGGRQLGKTVLQKETERQFHNPDKKQHAVYIDLRHNGIGGYRPIEEIKEVLIDNLKVIPGLIPEKLPANIGLKALMDKLLPWFTQNEEGRIVLFLDESDKFLEQDSKKDWENILPLKGLMETTEKRFKVILAGLHDVRRTIKIPNSPLAHFGNPICVGPMLGKEESLEAQLLVKLPLETLGYKFESDDLVMMILSHCNWYPSLIQIFCSSLLKVVREKRHIDKLPVIINEKDITRAYEISREHIKEKFNLTLGLDERYNLLANVVAAKTFENSAIQTTGMSVRDITDIAMLSWQEGFDNANPHIDIRNLLEEMVDLGILRNVNNENFALRAANLLGMIGNQNQIEEYLFETTKSLPVEFKRDVSRIIYNKDNREKRSPFPASYYDIIMRPENKVVVFRGSKLSGIDHVSEFLNSKKEIFIHPINNDVRFSEGFEEVSRVIERKKLPDKKHIIIVSSNNDYTLQEVLASREKLDKRSNQTVLFLMSPATYWRFLNEDNTCFDKINNQLISVVNMPLWKKQIVREWFKETGCNSADIQKIIDVIGYWHFFIDKYHEKIFNRPELWQEELIDFEKSILKDKEIHLAHFGLLDSEMKKLIEFLIEWDGNITRDEFIKENGVVKSIDRSEIYINYFISLNIVNQNLKVDEIMKKFIANG